MRGFVPHFEALAREFEGAAHFKIVYIKEAHARDVWPISSARCSHDGKPVQVETPHSDAERCRLAAKFAQDYNLSSRLPVLVDSVEENDPFEHAYAPWPIRFYVLMREHGDVKVKMKAQPHAAAYDLAEVREALLECCTPVETRAK